MLGRKKLSRHEKKLKAQQILQVAIQKLQDPKTRVNVSDATASVKALTETLYRVKFN